jgi:hypothetical protein
LIRPSPHLRDLIARATPQQAARAVAKAKEYSEISRRMGLDTAPAERVLIEALEMEISGMADTGDERPTVYEKRNYTHYQEQ